MMTKDGSSPSMLPLMRRSLSGSRSPPGYDVDDVPGVVLAQVAAIVKDGAWLETLL